MAHERPQDHTTSAPIPVRKPGHVTDDHLRIAADTLERTGSLAQACADADVPPGVMRDLIERSSVKRAVIEAALVKGHAALDRDVYQRAVVGCEEPVLDRKTGQPVYGTFDRTTWQWVEPDPERDAAHPERYQRRLLTRTVRSDSMLKLYLQRHVPAYRTRPPEGSDPPLEALYPKPQPAVEQDVTPLAHETAGLPAIDASASWGPADGEA